MLLGLVVFATSIVVFKNIFLSKKQIAEEKRIINITQLRGEHVWITFFTIQYKNSLKRVVNTNMIVIEIFLQFIYFHNWSSFVLNLHNCVVVLMFGIVFAYEVLQCLSKLIVVVRFNLRIRPIQIFLILHEISAVFLLQRFKQYIFILCPLCFWSGLNDTFNIHS